MRAARGFNYMFMFNLNDKLEKSRVRQFSPITLAFIGDAVYSLFIREKLVFKADDKGAVLNKKTAEIVCAKAQADYIESIMDILTDDEKDVYRRARNAKKGTRAKSASVSEYNKSTGFEAVVGYLYMSGEIARLNYLLNLKDDNDEN